MKPDGNRPLGLRRGGYWRRPDESHRRRDTFAKQVRIPRLYFGTRRPKVILLILSVSRRRDGRQGA